MPRTVSVSELALDTIYKALDHHKDCLDRNEVTRRSKQYNVDGITKSPSRLMKRVEMLAPNFGIRIE